MTALEQAILAALKSGPKKTNELKTAIGEGGSALGNTLYRLRIAGLISREPLSQGRWRYHLGQTSPAIEPNAKAPTVYRVPVRKVIVTRAESSFSTAAPVAATVTLPAEPWL